MKLFQKTFLLLVALALLPLNTLAFQAAAEEELVINGVISDDFYGAGGTVQINSNIDGDATIAGGEINSSAKISKDAILLGGEIRLTGDVEDDAHLAAGNIYVNSRISGDAMMAAGTINIESNSVIAGDLMVAAGEVRITGEVQGNLYAAVDKIYIDGVINGNTIFYGGTDIQFGDNGRVNGNLNYEAIEENKSINPQKVGGSINYEAIETYHPNKDKQNAIQNLVARFSFVGFLAILILGLFAIWGFKYYLINAAKVAHDQPFASFGSGLFVVILTPVIALLLLITGIGYLASLFLFTTWAMILILMGTAASLVIGFKLMPPKKEADFWRLYSAFALGALIYSLLIFVPYAGWAAQFILSTMGIGAMGLYEMELGKLLRKKKLV